MVCVNVRFTEYSMCKGPGVEEAVSRWGRKSKSAKDVAVQSPTGQGGPSLLVLLVELKV